MSVYVDVRSLLIYSNLQYVRTVYSNCSTNGKLETSAVYRTRFDGPHFRRPYRPRPYAVHRINGSPVCIHCCYYTRMAQTGGGWSRFLKVYNPLKAGSIDGTDTRPHDRGIERALESVYVPNKDLKSDPTRTLFIGRMNPDTDEESLYRRCSEYGAIESLTLIRDVVTGFSKRYAFVEYELQRDADEACTELDSSYLDNHKIFVDWECSRTLPGWIPRRLGGGFSGKKESGQLRFGGKDRPFKKPIILSSDERNVTDGGRMDRRGEKERSSRDRDRERDRDRDRDRERGRERGRERSNREWDRGRQRGGSYERDKYRDRDRRRDRERRSERDHYRERRDDRERRDRRDREGDRDRGGWREREEEWKVERDSPESLDVSRDLKKRRFTEIKVEMDD